MVDQRRGPNGNREVWNSILLAGDDVLTHELWCAVIRAVATTVLTRIRAERPSSEQPDDCDPDILVAEWQDASMPYEATLAWVVGEYDYFRDIDMSWDEKVSLSGKACGFVSDVVWDLKDILDFSPDAQDAVTEESVEEFFSEWRSRFLQRVLQEAAAFTVTDEYAEG